MHDKAEFECVEEEFAVWRPEIKEISPEIPGKRANLAGEKVFCAYNFNFFTFLYAFSCEKQDFPSKS